MKLVRSLIAMCCGTALSVLMLSADSNGAERNSAEALTFNRDIAPLLYENCSGCHHAGGNAPFSLVTFSEAKRRLRGIVKAVSSRTMPPWQPEPMEHHFLGERRLTEEQINLIQRWAEAGALEGKAADLQPAPVWNDGWKLGPPDVVLSMREPFVVPAAGRDIYRNFVLSAPATQRRYVRAVEIQPGNSRVVHHAFVLTDRTGSARRRQREDQQPGFDGMDAGGASTANGHFLSWQPGKTPGAERAGIAWVLEPGTEFVLQLHMRPSGKPETVQASIGLYFTDEPPTKTPMTLLLRSTGIDIPAGEKDYAIESHYTLPVDVDILAVLPHLHCLGREVKAWAELPDGSQQQLLWIKEWDFDWQGDYRYAQPVTLPKGTTLRMRFTYDNSADNPQNPSNPPKRTRYGLQTEDEMGEFWLQVLPRNAEDFAVLTQDYLTNYGLPDTIGMARALLKQDPNNASASVDLAMAYYASGRRVEAVSELKRSITSTPTSAALFTLAMMYVDQNRVAEAKETLKHALKIDPADYSSRNNLGMILLEEGNVLGAAAEFEQAVRANPSDAVSQRNLEKVRRMLSLPKGH